MSHRKSLTAGPKLTEQTLINVLAGTFPCLHVAPQPDLTKTGSKFVSAAFACMHGTSVCCYVFCSV